MKSKNNYHELNKNVEQARKCLNALGAAWRGDWSHFDGRTLRDQLEIIDDVLSGKTSYKEFCDWCGIDQGKLCWERNLYLYK